MSTADDGADDGRRTALSALAAAAPATLAALWDSWPEKPAHRRVRGPETGLVMVRGCIGGGGAPFNLGETTVSRATIRLDSGEIGHGYCLGRDHAKAEIIAIIDALRQRDPALIDAGIIAPLGTARAEADAAHRQEVAATRVDFFTMVRGDD